MVWARMRFPTCRLKLWWAAHWKAAHWKARHWHSASGTPLTNFCWGSSYSRLTPAWHCYLICASCVGWPRASIPTSILRASLYRLASPVHRQQDHLIGLLPTHRPDNRTVVYPKVLPDRSQCRPPSSTPQVSSALPRHSSCRNRLPSFYKTRRAPSLHRPLLPFYRAQRRPIYGSSMRTCSCRAYELEMSTPRINASRGLSPGLATITSG